MTFLGKDTQMEREGSSPACDRLAVLVFQQDKSSPLPHPYPSSTLAGLRGKLDLILCDDDDPDFQKAALLLVTGILYVFGMTCTLWPDNGQIIGHGRKSFHACR